MDSSRIGVVSTHSQVRSSGFTLTEVLAALIIVAIALAALAPVLALVAYRRAISERIEVATQLARGEVDRISTIVDIQLASDPASFDVNLLPEVTSADPLSSTAAPPSLPATVGTPLEGAAYGTVTRVEVEIPGRAPEVYALQTFRDAGEDCINPVTQTVIAGVPCSFTMGVRVYHRLSFDPSGNPIAPLGTDNVYASQNIGSEQARVLPMANQIVEINLAADLRGICEGLAANPATDCSNI